MSDVIVGGEKLVSTSRAAELSGYSKDYVGQLCRGGKLECRRISGHWYVDEASLQQYKQGDPQAQKETERAKTAFGMKVGNVRDDTFTYDGVEYVATSRGAELTGYAQDYVGQLARNGEIKARKVGRRWFVGKESLVEHKKHNDGLLASVQAKASGLSSSAPIKVEQPEEVEVEGHDEEVEIEIHKNVEPGDINFNVRYIPETDRPLVPKLQTRISANNEYAPGDIDAVPTGHVTVSDLQLSRPPTAEVSKIVDTRYTNKEDTSSRQGTMGTDIRKPVNTFLPATEKKRGYPFWWLALAVPLLLGAVLLSVGYFLGGIPTFYSAVEDASSTALIQSLNDSYGDFLPGFEVEYTAK
ncbi:hypothetical protein CL652_01385 [bacterium]|nr:hypothetical protein [bacterium]